MPFEVGSFSALDTGELLQVTAAEIRRQYIFPVYKNNLYQSDYQINETTPVHLVEIKQRIYPQLQFVAAQLIAIFANVCPIVIKFDNTTDDSELDNKCHAYSIHAKSLVEIKKSYSELCAEAILIMNIFGIIDAYPYDTNDAQPDPDTGEHMNLSHGRFFDFGNFVGAVNGGSYFFENYNTFVTSNWLAPKRQDFEHAMHTFPEIKSIALEKLDRFYNHMVSSEGRELFYAAMFKARLANREFSKYNYTADDLYNQIIQRTRFTRRFLHDHNRKAIIDRIASQGNR